MRNNQVDEVLAGLAADVSKQLETEAESLRQGLDTLDLVAAATMMKRIDDLTEVLGKGKAAMVKLYDTLRFATVPSLMDAQDVRSITIDGIGRVQLADDVQCGVPDKDALKEWLVGNGFEDLITSSVNAQTLAAFARRRLKAGDELPPQNIMTIKPIVRASITAIST